MSDPTRRQIMQMADEVGITDYAAAARLVRLALAVFRPAPTPAPVSDSPKRKDCDHISIDEMCEILRSLEIQAAEYTDCTILYELTFDQLRAICDTRAFAILAQRHPTPVPVSERLPGPEDCDAEGLCWAWNRTAYTWGLFRLDLTAHSHWLLAHALPVPQGEVEG